VCGITGWIDFGRDLTRERATARAMTGTLACRGPDDEGLWLSRHAVLGHRRLAVIDPADGRQPMTAEADGRTLAVVTFCGEIYNFTDLRAELTAHGHQFRTRSDTEVLLRAYLQWGNGFARRLNGMFAVGIWDLAREELVLARDRMGVKPLYYFATPHGAAFGSSRRRSWPTAWCRAGSTRTACARCWTWSRPRAAPSTPACPRSGQENWSGCAGPG
jgi:asparagine synthase (glutamine-hydrolysing)